MGNSSKFLPLWLWGVVRLQILLLLFFSLGTAINPGQFIPGAQGIDYVTQLYVTRNLTVALGLIVGLYLRSYTALLALLIVRVLTDMADVATVYALQVEPVKESVPMVVLLLILPALFAITHLWKLTQS